MGLDMYLKASRYVGKGYQEPDPLHTTLSAAADQCLPPDGNFGSIVIERDVAYWRKANQIHQWFVTNVQDGVDDCGNYPVSRADLIKLRSVCQQVLEGSELVDGPVNNGWSWTKDTGKVDVITDGKIIPDHALAEQLLPTQGGFFFGSTDYDQYYIEDLTSTIEQIDRILTWCDANKIEISSRPGEYYIPVDFEYHSSW